MLDKYEALKRQIESQGFEVIEGQFTLADGTTVPCTVRPVDPEQLVYACARVYASRNQVRKEQTAERDRLELARAAGENPHPG